VPITVYFAHFLSITYTSEVEKNQLLESFPLLVKTLWPPLLISGSQVRSLCGPPRQKSRFAFMRDGFFVFAAMASPQLFEGSSCCRIVLLA